MSVWRRARFWVVLALAVLIAAFVAGPGQGEGRPLDPSSTGELGAKALVLLLRDLDASVEVRTTGPSTRASSALLLSDQLDQAETDDLREWVAAGGTLLLADPGSSLAPPQARPPAGDQDVITMSKGCGIRALAGIDQIRTPAPVVFQADADSVGCFPAGDGSFMVATRFGSGIIVAMGSPAPFVNKFLDEADNAALAAAVLAPAPGSSVVIIDSVPRGTGQKTLMELIDPRVKSGLLQLIVAFVLVVAWRLRRLGQPVVESVPVEVSGSEMVLSIGRLLEKSHHRERAMECLRDDVRGVIEDRLGISRQTEVDGAVHALSARVPMTQPRLHRAMTHQPATDSELVELAADLELIRQEVVHAR